jgi:rhamnogalacturonan acetylesterase
MNNPLAFLMPLLLATSLVHAQTPPATSPSRLPILFIAGDSTVHNHDGLVGWGDIITPYFNPNKISVQNHALGGRSSRTFIQEGHWDEIKSQLRPGDFVLLQFGHNDSKSTLSLDRYTLPGTDDTTSEQSTDPKTHQPLTLYTFGHYMRQMIHDTLAAGATPLLCSPVPRNKWDHNKIVRGESHTADWAAALATENHVPFLDLNSLIADRYDALDPATIKSRYFPKDNTHNNQAGAQINAACVILALLSHPTLPLTQDLQPTADSQAITNATLPPSTQPATQNHP